MSIRPITRNFMNKLLWWNLCITTRLWRYYNQDSNPRLWSNRELKRFAPLFTGHILNVSGGKDKDKEGQWYRNYFTQARSYQITNYVTEFDEDPTQDEILFDLNQPLSPSSHLVNKFDVVFTHTVLEHVYKLHTAVENLCHLTKDILLTVVPYLQAFHQVETQYHDYWRVSPYVLVNLCNEYHLKTLYINWNHDPIGNIYLFHIASKQPQKWAALIQMPDLLMFGPGYYRDLVLQSAYTIRPMPTAQITTLDSYINDKNTDQP